MASNRRKKPLHGAKKYSRLPLVCHVKGCDADFFVATPTGSTPTHKRACTKHYYQLKPPRQPTAKQQQFVNTLKQLGLVA
jgi:hypothetical protein